MTADSSVSSVREEIGRIEAALRPYVNPEQADHEKLYLKSPLDFMGVGVPATRRAVKGWLRSRPKLCRADLLRLVRALWRRRVHELRLSAVELLRAREQLLLPTDVELLESMLRTAWTWAFVDTLACHVVSPLMERCPELDSALDRWADDDAVEDQAEVERAWQAEIERRIAEYERGGVETIPAADVFRQARSRLRHG